MLRLPRGAFMTSRGGGSLVEGARRLALTGTPGTGKTTVAELLADAGLAVESVEQLAERHGFIGDVDPLDGARPVDLWALSASLEEEWRTPPDTNTVIDGHLSHNLPVNAVVVLRCSPDVLESRLNARGYTEEKISENCDWELLGGAWNESRGDVPWIEFDTSLDSAERIVAALGNWMADGFKTTSHGSVIDWVAVQEG